MAMPDLMFSREMSADLASVAGTCAHEKHLKN